jgi:elongation factor Ts
MTISAAMVKELRVKTGAGMMDCKKALTKSEGDIDAAVKFLREKGLSVASKKADREANEGRVFSIINKEGQLGVIVEVNCETDFVANSEPFLELGNKLSNISMADVSIKAAEDLSNIEIENKSFKEFLAEYVLKVGENISIKRLNKVNSSGQLFTYIHMNGKIGVLLEFNQPVDDSLGQDISMHIAAASPSYLAMSDIDQSEIDKEKEIMKNHALNEGKPEKIIDRIVEGKIAKYCKEICLLEQVFVKDSDKTIKQILPAGIEILSFQRYALG